MNTVVTSRETILRCCRNIVSEKGISALNMRGVATECGVALGSIYNYFSSKDDLITSAIESVWQDIFHMDEYAHTKMSFTEYVCWIFKSVQKGTIQYPQFFTAHSISLASGAKNRARVIMDRYFAHIKAEMLTALQSDTSISPDAFTEEFSQSGFLDFVLSNIISLLLQKKENCNMLMEIIRRTIY